jgi:hypothetical protein
MDYRDMTKRELLMELQERDLKLAKQNALIKTLRSRLDIFHTGNFLGRSTRKALAFLLAKEPDNRADFDVGALEYDKYLDIYTYYDEFGMKLCLRMTPQKITR